MESAVTPLTGDDLYELGSLLKSYHHDLRKLGLLASRLHSKG